MILLTCANIFLRLVWLPISGAFELMGFFGAIAAAFSLGYTQNRRGHISVDFLISKFSDNAKNIINTINSVICLVFFTVAAWQIAKKATTLLTTGEVTETLRIIYYPFTYAVAFGCLALSLVFLTDLLKHPEKTDEKGEM
ncbi:MAG: TRAP transporter small permease [Desulfobacterales bacterium]|nr:TRAP transporter small permease [Desulfobacterales bacterium]